MQNDDYRYNQDMRTEQPPKRRNLWKIFAIVIVFITVLCAATAVLTYNGKIAFVPSVATQALSPIVLNYGASGYRYKVVPTGADAGFQAPTSNDSAFQNGTAAFGVALNGCPLEPTIKTPWASNTDILVRHTIVFAELPTTGVTIHIAIDNDVVVYWNGIQVGSLVHDGCAAKDSLIAKVPTSALLVGKNILAIRGIDRGASTYLDLQVLRG